MEYSSRNKLMCLSGLLFFIQLFSFNVKSQDFHVSVGTDVPYQFYAGGVYGINNFEFSYKTGILVAPYSDAVLSIIEALGADSVYSDLLHSAYRFGWMNTLNISYRFGKAKTWYVGSEFRFDKLTASETSTELVETVSGEDMANYRRPRQNKTDIDLGVNLAAIGLRFGKSFNIGQDSKNSIRVEISASKYILSTATVRVNGTDSGKLSTIFDDLLCENVFKSYGYVGGFGIAYCYKIK